MSVTSLFEETTYQSYNRHYTFINRSINLINQNVHHNTHHHKMSTVISYSYINSYRKKTTMVTSIRELKVQVYSNIYAIQLQKL